MSLLCGKAIEMVGPETRIERLVSWVSTGTDRLQTTPVGNWGQLPPLHALFVENGTASAWEGHRATMGTASCSGQDVVPVSRVTGAKKRSGAYHLVVTHVWLVCSIII